MRNCTKELSISSVPTHGRQISSYSKELVDRSVPTQKSWSTDQFLLKRAGRQISSYSKELVDRSVPTQKSWSTDQFLLKRAGRQISSYSKELVDRSVPTQKSWSTDQFLLIRAGHQLLLFSYSKELLCSLVMHKWRSDENETLSVMMVIVTNDCHIYS